MLNKLLICPATPLILDAAFTKPPANPPMPPSLLTEDAMSAVMLLVDPAKDPTFFTRFWAAPAAPANAPDIAPPIPVLIFFKSPIPGLLVKEPNALPDAPDRFAILLSNFNFPRSDEAWLNATPACELAVEIVEDTWVTSFANGLGDKDT
jgi:hypothetical protein